MKRALFLATALFATPAAADPKADTTQLMEKTLKICKDAAVAAKAGGNAKDRMVDAYVRERGAFLALQDGKLKEAAKLSLLARTNCFMVLTQNGKGMGMDVASSEHALARDNDAAAVKSYEGKGSEGRPTEAQLLEKFEPHAPVAGAAAAAAPAGVELSADAKVLLDKSCGKMAKEKASAPCNGVAQATLFELMMGSSSLREQLKNPAIESAAKSYCQSACEAARK